MGHVYSVSGSASALNKYTLNGPCPVDLVFAYRRTTEQVTLEPGKAVTMTPSSCPFIRPGNSMYKASASYNGGTISGRSFDGYTYNQIMYEEYGQELWEAAIADTQGYGGLIFDGGTLRPHIHSQSQHGCNVHADYDHAYIRYWFKDGYFCEDTNFATKRPGQAGDIWMADSTHPIPIWTDSLEITHVSDITMSDYLSTNELLRTEAKHYTYFDPFYTRIKFNANTWFGGTYAENMQREQSFFDKIERIEICVNYFIFAYKSTLERARKGYDTSKLYKVYNGYSSGRREWYSSVGVYESGLYRDFAVHAIVSRNESDTNYEPHYANSPMDTEYATLQQLDNYTHINAFSKPSDNAQTDAVDYTSVYSVSDIRTKYDISQDDDESVIVTTTAPQKGLGYPADVEAFYNSEEFVVPVPFVKDDRWGSHDYCGGSMLYSSYWGYRAGVSWRGASTDDEHMLVAPSLGPDRHTINSDGTITIHYEKYTPNGAPKYPVRQYTGSLEQTGEMSFMPGRVVKYLFGDESYNIKSVLLVDLYTATDDITNVYDSTDIIYTRPEFPLSKSMRITNSPNPDSVTADGPQTYKVLYKYRTIDRAVTLKPTIVPGVQTDKPGWGYEFSDATNITVQGGTSGYVRKGPSADNIEFTLNALSLEDTDLEGGSIKLKLYTLTGETWDSKELYAEYDIYIVGEYYEDIVPSATSVYITGADPEKIIRIDTNPATSLIDSLDAECSNDEIAEIELDDHTLTITQVATGRCTVRVWSTIFPGSYSMITVISGTTEPGGADDEPDDYTDYPEPTDPEDPLEPEARAQHAYFYDMDWRTSQLKQHCGGFDHGIGRGKTFNAAPGTLYIVYSEHSKREYFRDGVRTEGMEDQLGKYIPTPLLQGDDVWHTDYEAPAFLDTGNIADRNGTSNKRFREVQYVLALDGDTNMQVAFAFLVDGAMRRPMLEPVAEYDPEADVITVSTEYDEPYSVAESTVGNLGEWKLDSHTLENAERVRVRQNVTGKGITASTRIVFKMSGQFKLLGVNYVYREMYSR